MMNPKVLSVDDDSLILAAMKMNFSTSAFDLETAQSHAEAIQLIRRNPTGYSLVFIDHDLGTKDRNGSHLASEIKSINPSIMVVILSGLRTEESLKAWLEADIDQYIIKPPQPYELLSFAATAQQRYLDLYGPTERDQKKVFKDPKSAEALRITDLVGRSCEIARVAKSTLLFADNSYNVLVLGETGTGKEVVAHAIHKNSSHADKPFLPINCSGFTGNENLLESELFGHEKGAFTGADRLKRGVFEDARGGSVFLDEIHHLTPSAQAKLLRVIQHRKIRRVGGNTEIKVDFRLISAGKPELNDLSNRGSFTLDLLYRIKELLIEIPPLRERREDIVPLIRRMKSELEHDLDRQIEIQNDALDLLESYSWPGNVRELSGVLKELFVTARKAVIEAKDLPPQFHEGRRHSSMSFSSFASLVAEQERQQRDLVLNALEASHNNITQASELIGVPRSTLRDLIKKFRIRHSAS